MDGVIDVDDLDRSRASELFDEEPRLFDVEVGTRGACEVLFGVLCGGGGVSEAEIDVAPRLVRFMGLEPAAVLLRQIADVNRGCRGERLGVVGKDGDESANRRVVAP